MSNAALPDISPKVFISATSRDLRTCRKIASDALLTLGCTPVEQTTFPPSTSTVRDLLRKKIEACSAVLHIVGCAYGAEPSILAEGEPRRSYTQLEYDIAVELKKPIYIFVCPADFPFDDPPPLPDGSRAVAEDADKVALQQAHRDAVLSGDKRYEPVADRDALQKRTLALETRVHELRVLLDKERRARLRTLAGAVGVLVVVVAGVVLALRGLGTRQQATQAATEGNTKRLNEVETELLAQRRYITSVADAYAQLEGQLRDLKLSPEELWKRAVASVAQREGLDADRLQSQITLFVVAVRRDPQAGFMDKALADFAEKNFASAATNAGEAAERAKEKRLAAEQVARQGLADVADATRAEREARSLQGQAFYAAQRYEQAVRALEQALALTPRESLPVRWAELQFGLGVANTNWASRSAGEAIAQRRAEAILAYRAALEVFTREDMAQGWARTQGNLANALSDQARASVGQTRAMLQTQAVDVYRAALKVRTREDSPHDWAMTQNNLANALSDQALAGDGAQRATLMAQAVDAYRLALEVYTREDSPHEWAGTQNNLAIALGNQALASDGPQQADLLGGAVKSYRSALEVRTRDTVPEDWATLQNNLANALSDQARASDGEQRLALLAQAVEAYRAALEVFTLADTPQGWAATQSNLANALSDQARASNGKDRATLLAQAVTAYRAALEVRTREALPQDWAGTLNNLAAALSDQARVGDSKQRAPLLAEAVTAYRAALEVRTREALPQDWAMTQYNLASALRHQALASNAKDRLPLLVKSVEAYRASLEVRTRNALPQDWAMTHSNLALALSDLAPLQPTPAQQAATHREAAAAMRAACEVFTKDTPGSQWEVRQAWIAEQEGKAKAAE